MRSIFLGLGILFTVWVMLFPVAWECRKDANRDNPVCNLLRNIR